MNPISGGKNKQNKLTLEQLAELDDIGIFPKIYEELQKAEWTFKGNGQWEFGGDDLISVPKEIQNHVTGISAPNATNIKCIGCLKLEKVNAPVATDVHLGLCSSIQKINAPLAEVLNHWHREVRLPMSTYQPVISLFIKNLKDISSVLKRTNPVDGGVRIACLGDTDPQNLQNTIDALHKQGIPKDIIAEYVVPVASYQVTVEEAVNAYKDLVKSEFVNNVQKKVEDDLTRHRKTSIETHTGVLLTSGVVKEIFKYVPIQTRLEALSDQDQQLVGSTKSYITNNISKTIDARRAAKDLSKGVQQMQGGQDR